MKTKWLYQLFATLLVSASLALAGQLRAQDLLNKKASAPNTNVAAANLAPEYQVMFQSLSKIAEALQGSTDRDSTANNIVALPKAVEDIVGKNSSSDKDARSQARQPSDSRTIDFKANGLIAWFLSKDFNIDDPFGYIAKYQNAEDNRTEQGSPKDREMDVLVKTVAIPQFTYLVGMTGALDTLLKARDSAGTAEEAKALTHLLNQSDTKE